MNNKLLKNIIVTCFIAVPILSSIISTLHLIDLFHLGNPNWLATALAITIEIGSIASFLTLSILSKLNKTIVWTVFIILFFMQLLGNMYFSYEWINDKMVADTKWILSFKEMCEFFTGELESIDVKMYLTIIISWPIPLISVFLLKSATDYIGSDKKEEEPKEKEEEKPQGVSFIDLKAEDREKFRRKFQEEDNEEKEK